MLPGDHVLNDDAETALELTICGRPSELISQAELRLGLGWSTRNHLHLAGNDHPAIRVSPNVNAAMEPPREEIGDRRLARSHETRDPVDAPPGFTHAVHPRDGRRTMPPAGLKFAQNAMTERSPERPGRSAISAHARSACSTHGTPVLCSVRLPAGASLCARLLCRRSGKHLTTPPMAQVSRCVF
jgi:hypothetical protein